MKGLLLKDWYLIKSYCRIYLLVSVVFLAAAVFGNSPMFFFYPMVFAGMVPVTLISYDEREKWNVYSLTLPIARAWMVTEKYLLGLCCVGVMATLVAVTGCLQAMAVGSILGTDALWMLISMGIGIGLIGTSIILPVVFRFGSEKGRVVYYFVIIIVCALSGVAVSGNEELPVSISQSPGTGFGIMAAVIALYAVSWLLSIAFYKKREC